MSEENAVEILIVEDTPEDLELALRALRKANLTNRIQIARDGAEAMEFIFAEGKHSGRKIEDGPKVVLLDLKLPKIDGMEILRRIKSDPRTKTIPVVVLTSSDSPRDRRAAMWLEKKSTRSCSGIVAALGSRGRTKSSSVKLYGTTSGG